MGGGGSVPTTSTQADNDVAYIAALVGAFESASRFESTDES